MADKPGNARTWIWILVAVIALGILAVIVLAGAGLYFFSQNVQTDAVTNVEAEDRFAEVRKRFETQKPLIELDADGHFLRSNPDRDTAADAPPPRRCTSWHSTPAMNGSFA
jgi:hypothetical protein